MKASITTPVARLVLGSLYKGDTEAMDGSPLINKKGEPYTNYWFNIAIPKGKETSWKETDWGKEIYAVGKAAFPNGQAERKSFSWKIIDGDSEEVSDKSISGKPPCKWEGYPSNWIMTLKTQLQFKKVDRTGQKELAEDQVINLGDFVQVNIEASTNNSTSSPGVYLTPKVVSYSAFGERIIVGVDPSECGFGEAPLPKGATEIDFLQGR